MKKLLRHPLVLDLANAFAAHGQEEKVSFRHPQALEGFLARTRRSLEESIHNEIFVYGLRTQAMFESLVASLASVQIIKQEDSGTIYALDESLKIPDYRLILDDGSQILVEVKNFYQGSQPKTPFIMEKAYLDGLRRYSRLTGGDLKIATYWVGWNLWTLVGQNAFHDLDGNSVLELEAAMTANEMSSIGDVSIATRFPLRIRLLADRSKPREVDKNGIASFVIAGVELYCEDRLITRPDEQRIAMYLMLYGRWREENEVFLQDRQIEAIEYRWFPLEDSKQGFEMVGSLSEMFSSFYRQATVEDGHVGQLQVDVTPGLLGQLVPKDYEGVALPLWRFIQKPAEPERK